jgi:hypothetical protein
MILLCQAIAVKRRNDVLHTSLHDGCPFVGVIVVCGQYDHAKFADDSFAPDKIKMVFDILFEIPGVFKIIVVSIIAHPDVRIGDDIF